MIRIFQDFDPSDQKLTSIAVAITGSGTRGRRVAGGAAATVGGRRGHLGEVAVEFRGRPASLLVDGALLGVANRIRDVHALEIVLGREVDVINGVANAL